MDTNDRLYTKEPDGTVQKWYVWGWFGPRFAVTVQKNAPLSAYRRYYHMDDVGKTIFLTRKEAAHAPRAKISAEQPLTLDEFSQKYADD